MTDDGITLSPRDRAILRGVLAPFADRIDRAAIFGSRALGRARPGSDIDLALYGSVDDRDVARIRRLLDESSLAVAVDVARYDGLEESPFRRHIDRCGKLLFLRDDLLSDPA